mgnify:CR=1 FL=1
MGGMDWIDRLDKFANYVQKMQRQGWFLMEYEDRDWAVFKVGDVKIKSEIDYDGKIIERKSKIKPKES